MYSSVKFLIWNKVISSAGFLFSVDWTCLANCSLLNLYSLEELQYILTVNFSAAMNTKKRVNNSHIPNLLDTVMVVVEVKLG